MQADVEAGTLEEVGIASGGTLEEKEQIVFGKDVAATCIGCVFAIEAEGNFGHGIVVGLAYCLQLVLNLEGVADGVTAIEIGLLDMQVDGA